MRWDLVEPEKLRAGKKSGLSGRAGGRCPVAGQGDGP